MKPIETDLLSILNYRFLDNTLQSWLLSLAVTAMALVALSLLKRLG